MKCPYNGFKECLLEQCPSCIYKEIKERKISGRYNVALGVDGEIEIVIRNSVNPCGNIQRLEQVEVSSYGSYGTEVPCVILNTENSKELEIIKKKIVDFID